PMYNVYSHLVYSACGSDVSSTIINGIPVVTDGRLTTFDPEAVMDDMQRIAQDVRSLHDWDNGKQRGSGQGR
ncbi:MAG: hypothetical protein ACQETG_03380, partial [Thermodesulfobacteriota bacterium]